MSALTHRTLPTLPKQHGAWSILVAAFLLGALTDGPIRARSWVLLAAILAGFIGQHNAHAFWRARAVGDHTMRAYRHWAIGSLSLAVALSVWLVVVDRLCGLLGFGVAGGVWLCAMAAFEQSHRHLTLAAELCGVLGVNLVVLVAAYCQLGDLSVASIALWLLCALFFVGSVLHVRYLVREQRQRRQGLRARVIAGLPSLLHHAAAFCVVWWLASLRHLLPPLSPFTLLPGLLKVVRSLLVPPPKSLQMRHIGLTELLHTLLFIALVLLSFHSTLPANVH